VKKGTFPKKRKVEGVRGRNKRRREEGPKRMHVARTKGSTAQPGNSAHKCLIKEKKYLELACTNESLAGT
jgi:hypothetical protein